MNDDWGTQETLWTSNRWGIASAAGSAPARTWTDSTFPPFGTPADVTALVEQLYNAFGAKNCGYIGYDQINTDVPLENAEAMLAAFARFS
ncbi:MAG: hypothetical protein WCI75_20805 [candidate division NC10 bacterium]